MEKLALGPFEKLGKVRSDNKSQYRVPIYYDDAKLKLSTHSFETKGLILSSHKNDNKSALVPISQWLRKQLNVIELFVKQNLKLPLDLVPEWHPTYPLDDPYKPLWHKDSMFLPLSKWCRFFQHTEKGGYELTPSEKVGEGTYSLTIDIAHVYVGPHKSSNKMFSLQPRVVQVLYKANVVVNIDNLINNVLQSSKPTIGEDADAKAIQEKSTDKPKRKRKKVTNLSEDIPTSSK